MIYKIIFLQLFLLTCSLSAANTARIEALLTIGDSTLALQELEPLLTHDPDNRALQRLEVKCLAKRGSIPALLKAYSRYKEQSKDDFDKNLLEDVAWAIILRASHSNTPIIRQEAYIASFLTNDAKGIPICLKALTDSSEQMRLLATALTAQTHDEVLQAQAHHAVQNDRSARVRLLSIKAVGSTRYEAAKETLLALLNNKNADNEEKMASIGALAQITKEVSADFIQTLSMSERAPLRMLACELVLSHYDQANTSYILPLMHDNVFDVRLAAIQCIGVLGAKPSNEELQKLLAHQDIKTKILANWLSLVIGYNPTLAIANLQNYLMLPDRTLRLFTAGAIAHAGRHVEHFSDCFMKQDDPLVRLNLALGFIWQRKEVERSCNFMLMALNERGRLSWQNIGIIHYIGPNTSTHESGQVRLPESEDLMCRLELYSILATCPSVSIQEPLRAFLKDSTWGISGTSACLMMQEGLIYFDELRQLLQDPNSEIRLQAAFILAFYAQDDEALKVLVNAFSTASRQMKEYILFAVATIGTKSALPFLLQVLNEPFESLRVVAARGILICLYK